LFLALRGLTRILKSLSSNTQIVILVDDYDLPIISCSHEQNIDVVTIQQKMAIVDSLLEALLKIDTRLFFVVGTYAFTNSIMEYNHFLRHGVEEDQLNQNIEKNYLKFFGFSPPEFQELCDSYGVPPERRDAATAAYNGKIIF
jgi:hypothetical protein